MGTKLKRSNKILVIRFSSIGDIVLTTAVVRCLQRQLRHAKIHFLTKKQNEAVLKANPYIDHLWLYDHDFKDLIPQLKSQEFNFVVDLHKNYRSAFVKRQLNVPSAAFPKLNVRKWLTVQFKINLLPDIHIVDRYFKTTDTLGITNDGEGLDYFIPLEDEVPVHSLPAAHQHGYVAIVTGGKHNTKIFPPEKVATLINRIKLPVILLGGPEDRDRAEQIVTATGFMSFNGCGLYNLNQSASLIRQSKVVLTNDTGLMHIAAALNKPMVSVWGNTIPAFGMTPYYPKQSTVESMIAEVRHLRCRPCSKLGYESCPKKHFKCMNAMELEPIAEFLTRQFKLA